MPKFSAAKFLDEIILPASIVFGVKIGGIFLGSLIFKIPWIFSWQSSSSFSSYLLNFNSASDLAIINSFSDGLALLAASLGIVWVVYRFNFLNLKTIHPKMAAALHRRKIDFLLADSTQIFHQALVWLLLSYLIFILTVVNCLVGYTSSLIVGLGLAVVSSLTAVFWRLRAPKH